MKARENRGGKRAGAGKPALRGKLTARTVKLSDSEVSYLQAHYGGLSAAVQSLLPPIPGAL